ncbi:Disease resistance protein [Melia azedarach]|uniref:Disease resistance protein n=1 Tax=Melia azedarach TaxID=155640 RepID=A0ACC1XS28_MELAZ|nr:Disease resistance protein [Melia azedarach]
MQLRGIEDLCVDGLQDMKNVLYGLDREGFPHLKYLEVANNPNLSCIIDSTEDVICNASAFPLLESLSLIDLPNMEKISCGQLAAESFGKLREIVVVDCNKLKNILSFSIARGLLQLQSIEVFRCQNMEQIFAIGSEDESSNNNTGGINIIEFGQLRSLILDYLPQLTSFCSRSDEIILADDIDIPNTLFNKKVTLPRLEVLELYETKVERIWQNQAVAMSCGIQNLTRLIISSCKNLRCLFSSSIATSFVQLQYLQICQCPALEEMVVDDDRLREEQRKNVVFPQLVLLKMKALQNLTKFCSGDYIEFPSLKKLKINNCPELKGFVANNNISTDVTEIPLFNEKVAFPSLESLSIRDCGSLEAIFDLEGSNFEDQLSAVTHLSELKIVGLPKLKHVWKKDSKKFLCFQSLRMVTLCGCERLKNVFPASIAGSLLQLVSLNISGCGVEEIVFVSEGEAETNTRFVFPGLTSLTLQDLPKCASFYPEVHTTEWPALKTLKVSGWEIVNIFNSEFHRFQRGQLDIRAQPPQFLVEKVFPNLEELIVQGKGIATIGQFPENFLGKLKFLLFMFDESAVFSSLDFLQRFHNIKVLKIGGGIQFQSSEEVENGISAWITHLNQCSDVKHLLKEETNMDHLVHLLVGASHNLVNLVPSSTSFQNLMTLELTYCDKLTNIVTSSTAKSLVRLRRMSLFECNMITEVVANDGDAEKEKDEIVFGKLKDLSLTCLKGLTSFCSGNCTFSFPSLEEVMVYKCPKMNIFARGFLSTPNLPKVKIDWDDKVGYWKGDLNTTIQQLHEETEELETWSYDEEEDAEDSVEEDAEESNTQD